MSKQGEKKMVRAIRRTEAGPSLGGYRADDVRRLAIAKCGIEGRDVHMMTFESIAVLLGLPISEVCALHNSAIDKIRDAIEGDPDFLDEALSGMGAA